MGYKIRRLHSLFLSRWQTWFARFGITLTPMQGGVLMLIDDYPGLTQIMLAGRLGIEAPTLSQAIGPLLKGGLIERRKVTGDRRSNALYLTDLGADAAVLIRREIPRQEESVLDGLSASERKELARLLDKALAARADAEIAA